MNRDLRLWVVVFGLATLHFFLHVGVGVGALAPDFLVVGLLVGARKGGMAAGAGGGLLFGLMEDAFSLLAFGANTLSLTVVGLAGGATRDLFVGDSRLFLIWYLGVGKWLRDLLQWVLVGEGLREGFVEAMVVRGTVAAVYTAVVGIAILAVSGAGRGASTT